MDAKDLKVGQKFKTLTLMGRDYSTIKKYKDVEVERLVKANEVLTDALIDLYYGDRNKIVESYHKKLLDKGVAYILAFERALRHVETMRINKVVDRFIISTNKGYLILPSHLYNISVSL